MNKMSDRRRGDRNILRKGFVDVQMHPLCRIHKPCSADVWPWFDARPPLVHEAPNSSISITDSVAHFRVAIPKSVL